jgi:apolipoprotein N-acyltransferase
LLVIITNDGWWGNTPGFRQHLAYGSLRAIEFRRSIVRSANTGISALINQRGQILNASSWWEPQVIKGSVNANNKLTLYARFGDYLGQLAIIALLIITPIFWFNNYKSSSSRKHGKI